MTTVDLVGTDNIVDLTGPASNVVDVTSPAGMSLDILGTNMPGPAGPSFRIVQIGASSLSVALAVGTGKAFFRVNEAVAGWKLTAVAAAVVTASSSGIPTVQIVNTTGSLDILSTALTIDQGEKDSATAAVPAVIDPTRNTLVAPDLWSIDVLVAGTGTIGLLVELRLDAP